MKTYTDADVRKTLRFLVEQSSYRRVAASFGVDHAFLNRIVNGSQPVSKTVASILGYLPVPQPERRWMRRVDSLRKKA